VLEDKLKGWYKIQEKGSAYSEITFERVDFG